MNPLIPLASMVGASAINALSRERLYERTLPKINKTITKVVTEQVAGISASRLYDKTTDDAEFASALAEAGVAKVAYLFILKYLSALVCATTRDFRLLTRAAFIRANIPGADQIPSSEDFLDGEGWANDVNSANFIWGQTAGLLDTVNMNQALHAKILACEAWHGAYYTDEDSKFYGFEHTAELTPKEKLALERALDGGGSSWTLDLLSNTITKEIPSTNYNGIIDTNGKILENIPRDEEFRRGRTALYRVGGCVFATQQANYIPAPRIQHRNVSQQTKLYESVVNPWNVDEVAVKLRGYSGRYDVLSGVNDIAMLCKKAADTFAESELERRVFTHNFLQNTMRYITCTLHKCGKNSYAAYVIPGCALYLRTSAFVPVPLLPNAYPFPGFWVLAKRGESDNADFPDPNLRYGLVWYAIRNPSYAPCVVTHEVMNTIDPELSDHIVRTHSEGFTSDTSAYVWVIAPTIVAFSAYSRTSKRAISHTKEKGSFYESFSTVTAGAEVRSPVALSIFGLRTTAQEAPHQHFDF